MTRAAALAFCFALAAPVGAQPSGGAPSPEEARRRAETMAALAKVFATEKAAGAKVAACAKAFKGASGNELRTDIVAAAGVFPCAELDTFLTDVLKTDPDAGLRIMAAARLGRVGAETCAADLEAAAKADKTTFRVTGGDQISMGSARGEAMLALAELAARFPERARDITAKLRAIELPRDADTAGDTADAKAQALYQLTRDAALIRPFFERLASRDAGTRRKAALAFSRLKLGDAPKELIAALSDPDLQVRAWALHSLTDIADPKSADAIVARATDGKEDFGVRAAAVTALGNLKSDRVKEPLRELAETGGALSPIAAAAYFRATGAKLKTYVEPRK